MFTQTARIMKSVFVSRRQQESMGSSPAGGWLFLLLPPEQARGKLGETERLHTKQCVHRQTGDTGEIHLRVRDHCQGLYYSYGHTWGENVNSKIKFLHHDRAEILLMKNYSLGRRHLCVCDSSQMSCDVWCHVSTCRKSSAVCQVRTVAASSGGAATPSSFVCRLWVEGSWSDSSWRLDDVTWSVRLPPSSSSRWEHSRRLVQF